MDGKSDIRRLTSVTFPAQRFLPSDGGGPPKIDFPFSETETAEAVALENGHWRRCTRFCVGVDLYNHQFWWEAHEVWERLWRCFPPDHTLRHGLQCLILVSAAHIQWEAKQPGGVERLLEKARKHLASAHLEGCFACGLDLEQWWREAVEPYFADSTQRYPFLQPE